MSESGSCRRFPLPRDGNEASPSLHMQDCRAQGFPIEGIGHVGALAAERKVLGSFRVELPLASPDRTIALPVTVGLYGVVR